MNYNEKLFDAISLEKINVVKKLISTTGFFTKRDPKADVNALDQSGCTPLHLACEKNNKKIAELLISKGANVNAVDKNYYGDTPLLLVSRKVDKGIAKLLITNGADVNAVNNYGMTPLHGACHKNEKTLAELLISKGANVNMVDKDGRSPLHIVCYKVDIGIAELLISTGADVNAVDNIGISPLHIACDKLHPPVGVLELFISNGAVLKGFNEPLSADVLLVKGPVIQTPQQHRFNEYSFNIYNTSIILAPPPTIKDSQKKELPTSLVIFAGPSEIKHTFCRDMEAHSELDKITIETWEEISQWYDLHKQNGCIQKIFLFYVFPPASTMKVGNLMDWYSNSFEKELNHRTGLANINNSDFLQLKASVSEADGVLTLAAVIENKNQDFVERILSIFEKCWIKKGLGQSEWLSSFGDASS